MISVLNQVYIKMYASIFVIFLLAFVVCSNELQHKEAKNYFKICNERDQQLLNECIKSTMTELKPLLAKGIPDLEVPPIEPMVINRLELSEGKKNFKFTQILTNLKIYGLGDYEVKEVKTDLKNLTFHTVLFQKRVDFDGDYEIDGQILILPIKGQGQVTYNFTDVTSTFDSVLEIYKKKDVDYLRIKSTVLNLKPKGGRVHFSNLFNGDKTLGDATNKFLNEHWHEAFETFRYLPETAFAEILSALANNVYDKFPLKELYPSIS